MSRTLVPAGANLIIRHGSHVLLLKRSDKATMWPNFWGFPGGKVDENEFFREAALREAREEIGIQADPEDIIAETILMFRTVQGIKIGYFGQIEVYTNAPEIREKDLACDLAWFPILDLPKPMIPQHLAGLDSILNNVGYREMDMVG